MPISRFRWVLFPYRVNEKGIGGPQKERGAQKGDPPKRTKPVRIFKRFLGVYSRGLLRI